MAVVGKQSSVRQGFVLSGGGGVNRMVPDGYRGRIAEIWTLRKRGSSYV